MEFATANDRNRLTAASSMPKLRARAESRLGGVLANGIGRRAEPTPHGGFAGARRIGGMSTSHQIDQAMPTKIFSARVFTWAMTSGRSRMLWLEPPSEIGRASTTSKVPRRWKYSPRRWASCS
jgi:hypothetical protein